MEPAAEPNTPEPLISAGGHDEDDLPEPPPPGGTLDRLMTATREEIAAHGLNGITTKAIAARAGVNEVTLFRRFGNKADLVRATLRATIAPFARAVITPGDDVAADLAEVSSAFATFIDAHPALVARVLVEMVGSTESMPVVRSTQTVLYGNLVHLLEHHRDAGRLDADIDLNEAARAFMGPVIARALLGRITDIGPFDADEHVRRYLTGWAG